MKSVAKSLNFLDSSTTNSPSTTNDVVVDLYELDNVDKLTQRNVLSKSRKRKQHQRAKEWTMLIETLKKTIDCIYEFCRLDQSIIECKVR